MTRAFVVIALSTAVLCDAGCIDYGDTIASRRQASASDASAADASAADASVGGCGLVAKAGCCDGDRLWWCEEEALRTVDCAERTACGWSERGYYDCDTAGSADPSGAKVKSCSFGDAGRPDLGVPDGARPCGEVGEIGCCAGSVLVFCDRGWPRAIACTRNPSCGWQSSGQIYNCGTAGGEDPTGGSPRACGPLPDIALPPADLGADSSDAGDGGNGNGADGNGAADSGEDSNAGKSGAKAEAGGCGCVMAQPGAELGGLLAATAGLLALLLLGRFQTWGR